MKRRAVIIGNDGGMSNYLDGVEYDIKNYSTLLSTNEGGAWENDEMSIFENEEKKDIQSAIIDEIRRGCDYMMIIFTGHGYCDQNGETYFELNPYGEECSLSDIKRWLGGTPCLMIADSCHEIPPGQKLILERRQRIFSSSGRYIGRDIYRERYDSYLTRIPKNTFIFASSCSLGQSSEDTDYGGLYSLVIFEVSKKLIKTVTSSEVISIGYVHSLAKNIVKSQTDGEQVPVITGIYRGIQQPPFLIILK